VAYALRLPHSILSQLAVYAALYQALLVKLAFATLEIEKNQ
jgi:hypothetical protein